MSLTHPPGPAGGRQLLTTHVAEIRAHPHLAHRALDGAASDALDASQPHRTYTMSLDDVRARTAPASLAPDGWRYLVFAGPRAVAAVELAILPAAPGLRFAHVSSGRIVSATVDALNIAEALPDVQQADHEVRLLRVPSLLFVALWLHGARDIVLPLTRHGSVLPPLTPHDGGAVLDSLQAKLQARGG